MREFLIEVAPFLLVILPLAPAVFVLRSKGEGIEPFTREDVIA